MCKETCRYFKGFVVKNFLKPLFLFWSYLGLETSKWNDSNWRRFLRPVALNIQKTTKSNYGTMSPEFGIQFQFSVLTGNQTSLECLCHILSFVDPK